MPIEPTECERQLTESLGFKTLQELTDIMNLPVVDNLSMQPPDTSKSTRWDEWPENQRGREQAETKPK